MTIPPTTNSSSVTTNVESDWNFDKTWGIFGGQDKHRITVQSDGKLIHSLVHQTFFDILMEKMFGGKHKETVTPLKEFAVHHLTEKQKTAFSKIATGNEKTFCEFEEKALKAILISLKENAREIKTDELEQRITEHVNRLNEDILKISSIVLTSKTASTKKVESPVASSNSDQHGKVSPEHKKSALFLSELPEEEEEFFEIENSESLIQEESGLPLEKKEELIDTHKPSRSLKNRVKQENNTKQKESRPSLLKSMAVFTLLFTGGVFAQRSNTGLFKGGLLSELHIPLEAQSPNINSSGMANFVNLTERSAFEGSNDDKFHDLGVDTQLDGIKYEEECDDGLRNGQGTQTFANGSSYTGEFKNGKFNGHGTLTLPDGASYISEFKNGLKSGQGTYTGAWTGSYWDGSYVGLYENDLPNGQGTYGWGDGRMYKGTFKDGLFHGYGVYTEPNGNEKYLDDLREKTGSDLVFEGRKYEGEYKDDLPDGKGVQTFSDGRKYEGTFKRGSYHGRGVYTLADERIQDGMFEYGRFIG